MKRSWKTIVMVASYILVAAAAFAAATFLGQETKLTQLEQLIRQVYVDEVDWEAAQDAAASAMVDALPDGWSYYISADEYESYTQDKNNAYVGVGMHVALVEGQVVVQRLEPGGSAVEMGIEPNDVLVAVDGKSIEGMSLTDVTALVKGEEGESVELDMRRGDQVLSFTVERRKLQVQVVTAILLDDNVGYITIANFNKDSAQQAIDAVEDLTEQGATALIFDVRNNGGGYKDEMVQLLDHLLPEGDLFTSVDYKGNEQVDRSDDACVQLPMAVLINGESYSAAEFFAAALEEYDWAITVGEHTVGKGHYQVTFQLDDGSAVALSIGKYFTPNGVSLGDTGGLKPQVEVAVDEDTAARIYAGTLSPQEDPQLQAAIAALK